MENKSLIKGRLIGMNFLEFAVWGAYLISMGRYLKLLGLGEKIGWFYAIQGIVSIFMPALIGIIADRWIQAQRLLGYCHLLAGVFMGLTAIYSTQTDLSFSTLFTYYTLSVAFFMPTIALSNSVAFNILVRNGMDTVRDFPPIRVFGTIGFIVSMWIVDLLNFQSNEWQFYTSALISILLFLYTFTLPACPIADKNETKNISEMLGLDAFKLFKQRKMALFFIFSMLLGVSLQITNAYANNFIHSFEHLPEFENTFGVKHTNILISLSQISETCCILLIPYFLKRFGIKNVMMIAMLAWVLRFGLFAMGNPGSRLWMFVGSMIVYGVAFDFFNISGALFVDKSTNSNIRSSAQGLFMLMTNGIGASIGVIAAQEVINYFNVEEIPTNWHTCWYIFAAYSLVVLVLFWISFRSTDAKNTNVA